MSQSGHTNIKTLQDNLLKAKTLRQKAQLLLNNVQECQEKASLEDISTTISSL